MKTDEIKWAAEQRFHFIEHRAFWYGELNRADLTARFGISIPQASKDLVAYQNLYPDNLSYDHSHKRYVSTEKFNPHFIDCAAETFLRGLLIEGAQESDLNKLPGVCESVPLPTRKIDAHILGAIVQCKYKERSIEVLYQSMNPKRPVAEWRRISPHRFATDGLRWHVRAFCHLDQKYKDFILSRCLDTREVGDSGPQAEPDRMWHETFAVELTPNPLLSKGQQKIIEADFGMQNGRIQISVRKALLYYFSKRLRLDVAQMADSPGEAPVVVANKAAFDEALREATK